MPRNTEPPTWVGTTIKLCGMGIAAFQLVWLPAVGGTTSGPGIVLAGAMMGVGHAVKRDMERKR